MKGFNIKRKTVCCVRQQLLMSVTADSAHGVRPVKLVS